MDLLPKEQFVLSRDVDFDQIFRIPIGDYEVGLIVIFGDEDDVRIVFDFFFSDEGHHVFCVPVEMARFQIVNLIGLFGPVDGFPAVEDGGRAIFTDGGDGFSFGIHMGQCRSHFFSRPSEHDGGGHTEGEGTVKGAEGKSRFLDSDGNIFIHHRGEDGERKEGGEGVGGIFRSGELEENQDDCRIDDEELGAFGGIPKVDFFSSPSFEEGNRGEETPWEEAHEEYKDVEIPCIMGWMLRNCGTEHMMDSNEIQDEIAAMEIAHGSIPGTGENEENQKTTEEMDVGHFPEIFFIDKK